MTGGDLIIYIIQNKLYDKPIFENGRFIGFMTAAEAAEKMQVGEATIRVWMDQGWLDGVIIGSNIYIPVDAQRPKLNPNGGAHE